MATLFAPFVTSNIPEMILLDNSVGALGIIMCAIKLDIYNFSKMVDIIEKSKINPPTLQIDIIEFLMILLKIEPSSFSFIILNFKFFAEYFSVFFLEKLKIIPTIKADK